MKKSKLPEELQERYDDCRRVRAMIMRNFNKIIGAMQSENPEIIKGAFTSGELIIRLVGDYAGNIIQSFNQLNLGESDWEKEKLVLKQEVDNALDAVIIRMKNEEVH